MRGTLIRIVTIAGGAVALAAVIGAAVFMIGGGGGSGPVFVDDARSHARLERDHPLTAENRTNLTAESLAAMTDAERDQVYARLTAGPVPDGVYDAAFTGNAVARLTGLGAALPGETAEFVRQVAELAWTGRSIDADAGRVKSVSADFAPVQVLINRISAIEGVAPDYRDFPVEEVPRGGILGLVLSTTSAYAVFPARLYCGASVADPRRESHVIDHRRNETIDGYRAIPDLAAGSRGLALREEVRMVRPGLYLGYAYAAGVPLGHVILSRESDSGEAGAADGPCWPGDPALVSR